MVTFTGTQSNFLDALKDLIELDYDAVEAYDAAITRLINREYKNKFIEFREDHQRHIEELSEFITKSGEMPPTGPSAKQWLPKGKVVIGSLIGDEVLLRAMNSNEVDTNTAYERLNERMDKLPGSEGVLRRGLEDERRHKLWLENILTKIS
ncbi:MAG TPA: ferritin-like domain-containing protein [Candidatus Nitrosotenuis sp.]|jgi:ferritin-like metal-binding protein YciE|nr:ferritin-like domain-containing protein [Candidatus Nitrosotenuis sp.]